MKRLIIQILSRQPFIFFRGILNGSLIVCAYFDIRANLSGTGVKVMPGSRVFRDVKIGANIYVGYNCFIAPGTHIGNYTSIGNYVIVGGGDHGVSSVALSSRIFKESFEDRNKNLKLKIGEDCWVGNGAIIKSGLSLGRSCVIGMGAVVTRSSPPYTICTGVPATAIRKRLTESQIKQIEESEWWKLDVQYAQRALHGISLD